MSIRHELAKIIGGKQPEPLTKIKGGGSDDQTFPRIGWHDKTDRRTKIAKWLVRPYTHHQRRGKDGTTK